MSEADDFAAVCLHLVAKCRVGKRFLRFGINLPQLFDRQNDPEELRDVSGEAAYAPVIKRMEAALRARLDPVALDARVKKRQAEVLEAGGGWDFAIKRGDLPFSPPPGVAASWS